MYIANCNRLQERFGKYFWWATFCLGFVGLNHPICRVERSEWDGIRLILLIFQRFQRHIGVQSSHPQADKLVSFQPALQLNG